MLLNILCFRVKSIIRFVGKDFITDIITRYFSLPEEKHRLTNRINLLMDRLLLDHVLVKGWFSVPLSKLT